MRKPSKTRITKLWSFGRPVCAVALALAMLAPLPCNEIIASAFTTTWVTVQRTVLSQFGGQETPRQTSGVTYAQRIKLTPRNPRALTFGEPIVTATVLDTTIATVDVKNAHTAVINGIMTGETILIISGKNSRITYAIEVGKPPAQPRDQSYAGRRVAQPLTYNGSYTVNFTPGFAGGSSFLRHSFEFSRKLSNNRTLRASSETFHFFGGEERGLLLASEAGFGTNRITLGLDSPMSRLDLLDSELTVSPSSFRGYAMRGLHYVASDNSRLSGLELFAGNARPQLTFFNQGEGRLAGAIVPVAGGASWRMRAGLFIISPRRKLAGQNGGMVWQVEARYAPDERTSAEGEAAYANGGLSWRARLNMTRGAFDFYGEIARVDPRSPLIAIGAQPGGRSTRSLNLQWRPSPRFNFSVSNSQTTTAPYVGINRVPLNSTAFFINANLRPTSGSQLSFSFIQQKINTPASNILPFLLNLKTHSWVVKYNQRISRRWANNIEGRFIFSREDNSGEQMNRGISLREQLRYSWDRGSITGFFRYQGNTPSLGGLILRNPALLPEESRAAFAANPVLFLQTNREAIPQLLGGIGLPLTRSTDAGLRFQTAFKSFNLIGEAVYSRSTVLAREQRGFVSNFSANLKLDAANSVQVNLGRSFGTSRGQTSLTIGYVHRFGAESGGGFQFSKLLGLHRGNIQGRVFLDRNGNGQYEADEPGIAGMKVGLGDGRNVITDAHGIFKFASLEAGEFDVALNSAEMGVSLRASKATLQHVSLYPRQTVNLSFGLTNTSYAAGRVFNDLLLTGDFAAGSSPGLSGVRLTLRPSSPNLDGDPLTQTVDSSGLYEFRNLQPGKYVLELDPNTIPANFQPLAGMTWMVNVRPLKGAYLDLPLAAQRAVSGIVYLDMDGDNEFNPQKDQVVAGAQVVAGRSVAVSNAEGKYLLRGLPAGAVEIHLYLPDGKAGNIINIKMVQDPALRGGVNLMVKR